MLPIVHGLLRDRASVIKIALRSTIGAETARVVSAWRVFRTQSRDAFAAYRRPFVSIDVLLYVVGSYFHLRHERRGLSVPRLDPFSRWASSVLESTDADGGTKSHRTDS